MRNLNEIRRHYQGVQGLCQHPARQGRRAGCLSFISARRGSVRLKTTWFVGCISVATFFSRRQLTKEDATIKDTNNSVNWTISQSD